MAYLDNTEITVDAILTKKGREKLAAGQGLNITKFALGDDEVDYTLYEPAHPKGSAYYDSAIKAIPITEASPDETQVLRYKLVTLPKGTTKIPKVEFGIKKVDKFHLHQQLHQVVTLRVDILSFFLTRMLVQSLVQDYQTQQEQYLHS
jgi:hypothetical protein